MADGQAAMGFTTRPSSCLHYLSENEISDESLKINQSINLCENGLMELLLKLFKFSTANISYPSYQHFLNKFVTVSNLFVLCIDVFRIG